MDLHRSFVGQVWFRPHVSSQPLIALTVKIWVKLASVVEHMTITKIKDSFAMLQLFTSITDMMATRWTMTLPSSYWTRRCQLAITLLERKSIWIINDQILYIMVFQGSVCRRPMLEPILEKRSPFPVGAQLLPAETNLTNLWMSMLPLSLTKSAKKHTARMESRRTCSVPEPKARTLVKAIAEVQKLFCDYIFWTSIKSGGV